jgi:hypothetical protein
MVSLFEASDAFVNFRFHPNHIPDHRQVRPGSGLSVFEINLHIFHGRVRQRLHPKDLLGGKLGNQREVTVIFLFEYL